MLDSAAPSEDHRGVAGAGAPDAMRARMTEAAFGSLAPPDTSSAGTVEFLVEGESFTFLKSTLACKSSIR